MDMTDLHELVMITDLHLDRARQELARITAREQAIADELLGIEAQIQAMFRLSVENAYRQAGADAQFDLWAQRRRAELQMDRARLRVMRAAAVEALRRAFGKSEALRLLGQRR
jgi:hypothetical protein